MLTISLTQAPATDLGYLLAKNPSRAQTFELGFGRVHVFYPRADEEVCTFALLMDVDPVGLVRGKGKSDGALDQYVNDRPYVASSFLSVAIAQVLRSALSGTSRERPELVMQELPLEAHLAVVPCKGGEEFLRGLFEPLGYEVQARQHVLDPSFPSWGESELWALDLKARVRLSDLLSHLYVLIPVLDDDKHYWIGNDEVDKLLKHGKDWLQNHPLRDAIVNRYLRRRRTLTREALSRLTPDEPDADERAAAHALEEELVEKQIGEPTLSLHQQRLQAVLEELKQSGAQRVLDLGCGEGKLLGMLLKEPQFAPIVGLDVSHRALEIASDKLKLDRLPPLQRERLQLMQGALTYRDARLEGFDAAAIVEVVEHLDASRLASFERVVWEFARPQTVVLTTPNRDYNAHWPTLPAGKLRHKDHRFEWTRHEFQTWAQSVAQRFGYDVRLEPIGPIEADLGAPTQMGVFTRKE